RNKPLLAPIPTMEDRKYSASHLDDSRSRHSVTERDAIHAPIFQFLKEGLHVGGGLSSPCPLADHCYAYRRFSAARQARSTLFKQARRPAYETLFGSKDLAVSSTIAPNRNILPPPQIPEHRHVACAARGHPV